MTTPTEKAGASARAGRYLRAILGLLLISGAATLAVSWMDHRTRSIISANERAHELAILSAVLPTGSYDNRPEQDVLMMIDSELLGSASAQPIYSARENGQVVTNVLTVTAPDGYVGPIQLLVGINRNGNITGVRAIRHKETPGLGDFIDTTRSAGSKALAGEHRCRGTGSGPAPGRRRHRPRYRRNYYQPCSYQRGRKCGAILFQKSLAFAVAGRRAHCSRARAIAKPRRTNDRKILA